MPRSAWLLLLPALAISTALQAQQAAYSPVLQIEAKQCAWRAGDDLRWAAPDLDESGWSPFDGTHTAPQSRLWFRCHLDSAALRSVQDPHLALSIPTAYELYFQGRRIGGSGDLSTGDFSLSEDRSWPLPPLSQQPAVFALRMAWRYSPGLLDEQVFDSFEIGNAYTLDGDRARLILASVRPSLPYVIGYSIAGLIGFLLLGLYYYDRTRRDLLWLSLACIPMAVLRLNSLCANAQVDYPYRLWEAITFLGQFTSVFQTLFFFALARRRVPWWLWVIHAVSHSGDLFMGLSVLQNADGAFWMETIRTRVSLLHLSAYTLVFLSAFAAFWPWSRLPSRLRPLVVCCYLWAFADFVYFAFLLSSRIIPGASRFVAAYTGLLLETRSVTTIGVIAILLWLLFRDQRQAVQERALLAGEMQAARDIQRTLVPATLPPTPGLRIEAAFFPAAEVGGDFYQIFPGEDDSTLIVLGDVSGKGLKAAMTGALAIGALRTLASEGLDPAILLTRLNRQIVAARQDGFITCLCALLQRDGTLVVANAGHLSPYLDGVELALDNGLPLGLAAEAAYANTALHLNRQYRLTLLTDGVLEARNPEGHLYGFDRTAAVSTRGASEIAGAAQAFGQEDDITVLTLQPL
jgi:hypothetical protein